MSGLSINESGHATYQMKAEYSGNGVQNICSKEYKTSHVFSAISLTLLAHLLSKVDYSNFLLSHLT